MNPTDNTVNTVEYWKECYQTLLDEFVKVVGERNSIKTQVIAAIIELNKEDQAWAEIWGILPITKTEFIEGQTKAVHRRQSAIRILGGLVN